MSVEKLPDELDRTIDSPKPKRGLLRTTHLFFKFLFSEFKFLKIAIPAIIIIVLLVLAWPHILQFANKTTPEPESEQLISVMENVSPPKPTGESIPYNNKTVQVIRSSQRNETEVIDAEQQ